MLISQEAPGRGCGVGAAGQACQHTRQMGAGGGIFA